MTSRPDPFTTLVRVRQAARGAARSGFTLVEILIVVVILGILAAMVIPSFASAVNGSREQAFVSSMRSIYDGAVLYMTRTGLYLEDSSSGQLPPGFEDYIDADDFENGTPIGGVWDFELNSMGITSGFGVHFDGTGETRDETYMTGVDELFDDGDLTTGVFRQIANDRYYYIIAE
jgi:prepilin-type N-terminal cleavage/methylation domain-containing protein